MPQYTIKEICALSGDEYGEVAGLIKMLERRKLAKAVGHKANPPGVRGKPSTIYELDGAFDFVLFDEGNEQTANETALDNLADEIAPEPAPEPQLESSVPSAENPEILVTEMP